MKVGTLALHAARGAWRAKRHRDVQCAIAIFALAGFAGVGAAGTATGIMQTIGIQYQALARRSVPSTYTRRWKNTRTGRYE